MHLSFPFLPSGSPVDRFSFLRLASRAALRRSHPRAPARVGCPKFGPRLSGRWTEGPGQGGEEAGEPEGWVARCRASPPQSPSLLHRLHWSGPPEPESDRQAAHCPSVARRCCPLTISPFTARPSPLVWPCSNAWLSAHTQARTQQAHMHPAHAMHMQRRYGAKTLKKGAEHPQLHSLGPVGTGAFMCGSAVVDAFCAAVYFLSPQPVTYPGCAAGRCRAYCTGGACSEPCSTAVGQRGGGGPAPAHNPPPAATASPAPQHPS